MNKLNAPLCLVVVLMVLTPCMASWQVGSDWKVASDSSLSVACTSGSYAWSSIKPSSTWSVSGNLKIESLYKVYGSVRFAFGDANHEPMLLVGVNQHASHLSQVEVSIPGNRRPNLMVSGYVPGGDNTFAFKVTRVGDRLKLECFGDKGFIYVRETPRIQSSILDSIESFGVECDGGESAFDSLVITTPYEQPGHYTAQAEAAMLDLIKNFWCGGLGDGCIRPGSHGWPTPNDPKGGIWDRGQLLFCFDTLYDANHDPNLRQRLSLEMAHLQKYFKPEDVDKAGSHPDMIACDDCGWNGLFFMELYKHTGNKFALDRADALMNSAYERWMDNELGGGMWYNDSRNGKSIYQTGVLLCSLDVWKENGDTALKDKAISCYEWLESHLLRSDGIYWADYTRDGPRGKERPNDIHESGSVSFLAGNMGMTVLHARMYRMTGDKKYLDRALRTAEGISRKFVKDGIYFDDRDGWANGSFARQWAEEVLTLPGIDPKHKQLLFRTADSIYKNARTVDGFYGAGWAGPAEGPDSVWDIKGTRAQQTMTSGSSANMIMAAAIAEQESKNGK
jgi:predicted alpha-1,6-mannanase (GH76 family)